MAIVSQFASTPSYADLAFKNTGVTTLVAGTPVKVDSANAISASNLASGIGVVGVAADGDGCVGVLLEDVLAGGVGRVRTAGTVVTKADGAVTAGAFVMASATASKFVKTQGAGLPTLGQALSTAADGEDVLVLLAVSANA